MDCSEHSMGSLFEQLGLANDPESINKFVATHKLDKDTLLEQAPFWNAGQADFIHEALDEDSDWVELIDQLDVMLRESA